MQLRKRKSNCFESEKVSSFRHVDGKRYYIDFEYKELNYDTENENKINNEKICDIFSLLYLFSHSDGDYNLYIYITHKDKYNLIEEIKENILEYLSNSKKFDESNIENAKEIVMKRISYIKQLRLIYENMPEEIEKALFLTA